MDGAPVSVLTGRGTVPGAACPPSWRLEQGLHSGVSGWVLKAVPTKLGKFLFQTLAGRGHSSLPVWTQAVTPVLSQASAGCQSARAWAAVHSMLGVSSSTAANSGPEAPGGREARELQEHTW